jgi:1-acyl-sn-glycerol-3-phosphate acyltransferase
VSIDRFDPKDAQPYTGYDERTAKRFWDLAERILDRLNVEVKGIENLPSGRGLLVMNHAFGWDAILPMAAIRRATGRRVWALGEHLWWRIPFLRKLAAAVGTVDGTAENVDELLTQDQLVLVLPGGLREAMKPRELRYRLLWGKRFGFVRAAMRNHAPIVPLAGVGADEIFELVGDSFARGRKWLHRDFPLPRPAWGVPIIHFPHLKYIVGEPIPTDPFQGETDELAVRRIRREVRGALEELIDDALASRWTSAGEQQNP